MDIQIPRIIMQMGDDHNIPIKWITSPSSIREYIPEWKYVLFTKEVYRDFVIKYFPDYLFYYDSFPYDIQRINAVCYMWMFKVGGVYMSLNFELVQNLESIFCNGNGVYFVPSNNDSKWYANSFIAAKPGCSIFIECLEAMKQITPWWCLSRNSKILYTTGAGMLSRVLRETLVPFSIIDSYDIPMCSVCEAQCDTPNSYIRRIADDSWDEWDTYFYNVIYCNWKIIILLSVIIIAIICLCFKISKPKRSIYIKNSSKAEPVKHEKIKNITDLGTEEWKPKTEIL